MGYLNDRWKSGEPDKHGYYLVAWRRRTNEIVVSELRYNPDAIYHWWFTRGYTGQYRTGSLSDALTMSVIAWMPMPDPPVDDPDVIRVDGKYKCEICQKDARDHPQSKVFPWPTFVKLCDGREVKV